MTARPRLLLDTEALVRAWRNDGPARELIQRAAVRDFSLCTSTAILDEVDEVLLRPRFAATADERQQFRRAVLLAADHLAIFDEREAPSRSPDPGDDHVIEAALRTGADIVVSQNKADLGFAGYEVRTAAETCGWLRAVGPFGELDRGGPGEQQEQARVLAELGGDPHDLRAGAAVRFRGITERLNYLAFHNRCRFAALAPARAARLTAQLVRAAGRGLVLTAAGGVGFDAVSGTWTDEPARDGTIPFDLVWSPEATSPAETILPDWGWHDQHRHRVLLAGAIVIVLAPPERIVGKDVRFLVLVGEPMPVVPPIDNLYRRAGCTDGRLQVTHQDQEGTGVTMTAWLAGGPSAILFPAAPPPRALDAAFDLAQDLCGHLRWARR